MNQMGVSLVAGVECLVRQPMEKTTETSIPDRGMSSVHAALKTLACDESSRQSDCSQTVEGVASQRLASFR